MQSTPSRISFGLKPRKSKYGDGTFPCYEARDDMRLILREDWKQVSLNRHVPLIYSQFDGMCTSNAACMTMMVERSLRNRGSNPILSPEYLYYLHSQWGTGSTLGENLRALVDKGTLTHAIAGRDGKSPPEDHKVLAQANRVLEFVDLNADFDAVASALQRRRPCVVGVRWPGGGGHAVCATELVRDGNVWAIRGPNSWGESWGERPEYTPAEEAWLSIRAREQLDGGWFTLTERQCSDFKTFGCWAVGMST